MPYLLTLVYALLLYASLYPWQFHGGPPLGDAMRHVFHTWPTTIHVSDVKDIILNLAVYVPTGFIGYLSSSRGPRLWRFFWPVASASMLSLSIETLQHYCSTRVPNLLDFICNTIGALGGVILAIAFESTLRSRWNRLRHDRHLRPSSALLLLILWASFYCLPLRPYVDHLWPKIKMLIRAPAWSWLLFVSGVLIWLTIGQLLRSIAPPTTARLILMMTAPVFLFARLAAPGRVLTWAEGAGALVGASLALLPDPWPRLKNALTALAWIALLVIDELRPFRFSAQLQPMHWIPFLDLLDNDWLASLLILLRKACYYGTTFWCVERAGVGRFPALLGIALLVAVLEAMQTGLANRVASMTDVCTTLLVGALLWRLEQKYGA